MKTFNGCRTHAGMYQGSIGRRIVRESQLPPLDTGGKPLIGGDAGLRHRKASLLLVISSREHLQGGCDWLRGEERRKGREGRGQSDGGRGESHLGWFLVCVVVSLKRNVNEGKKRGLFICSDVIG